MKKFEIKNMFLNYSNIMYIMLDKKDIKILNELKKNGREPTKSIAKKVNLPRATVHDRIKRMVERGIIKKFTVKTDYKKIDLPTTVFIFIAVTPNNVKHQDLADQISKFPGVYEVHMITGEYDLLVKVRGENIEDIGNMVIDRLRILKGVEKSFTSACFRTIKEEI
jgi:DNA-binding Lrp family transcriptional regulator